MLRGVATLLFGLLVSGSAAWAAQPYLGFDRNNYPGDATLPALRRTFRYTGYWLNSPPGETKNSWTGERALLKENGFGFLVLFNGRLESQLAKAQANGMGPTALGTADGRTAVTTALREGFAPNVRIFLDQEEGGRLLSDQAAYLFAWVHAVQAAGARAGVYCSGIPVKSGSTSISTAQDIAERLSTAQSTPAHGQSAEHRRLALWIADDRCPPSPGCSTAPPQISELGTFRPAFISVWQYALSPRRSQFSATCPQNQAPDGNCYAPVLPHNSNTFVDLDAADSPDPSEAP